MSPIGVYKYMKIVVFTTYIRNYKNDLMVVKSVVLRVEPSLERT